MLAMHGAYPIPNQREVAPLSERMHRHGPSTPPQDMSPERFNLDAIGKCRHACEEGFGDQDRLPRLSAQPLQAGRRIHDVAEVGDLVPVDADFRGDDAAAVERCPELRDDAEARDPVASLGVERPADGKDAADAPGPFKAALERPGDDHLITDVVIDLAAMPADWFGNGREDVPQQLLGGKVAVCLRVGGRADEIEEEEDALLADRMVIATEDQAAERGTSDQVAHPQDASEERRHNQGVKHGLGPGRYGLHQGLVRQTERPDEGADHRHSDDDNGQQPEFGGGEVSQGRQAPQALAVAREYDAALVRDREHADTRAVGDAEQGWPFVEQRAVECTEKGPRCGDDGPERGGGARHGVPSYGGRQRTKFGLYGNVTPDRRSETFHSDRAKSASRARLGSLAGPGAPRVSYKRVGPT